MRDDERVRAIRSTSIIGRNDEVSTLRELVLSATAHRGGSAFVIGEAGIGKSRLLAAAADLARKHCAGRTIGLKIRYDNFKTVTRDRTLEAATADAATIRRAAGECLKRVPLDRRIRLLGVRVGGLIRRAADSNAVLPSEAPEPTLLD